MYRPAWAPVPYYPVSTLAKLPAITKLPHKLGYIPEYLKKHIETKT